jgi:hypothetical protein
MKIPLFLKLLAGQPGRSASLEATKDQASRLSRCSAAGSVNGFKAPVPLSSSSQHQRLSKTDCAGSSPKQITWSAGMVMMSRQDNDFFSRDHSQLIMHRPERRSTF